MGRAVQKSKIRQAREATESKVVDDIRVLYIVRVLNLRGRLLGYIGRKIIDYDARRTPTELRDMLRKTFGRKLYTGNTTRAGGEWRQYEGWQFVYTLCSDIISPERQFMRPTQDPEKLALQRAALQKYLKRQKIDVEAAHCCTLKYHTRQGAKQMIEQLPSAQRRQVKYRVTKIELQWGKPYTARRLSNR